MRDVGYLLQLIGALFWLFTSPVLVVGLRRADRELLYLVAVMFVVGLAFVLIGRHLREP